MNENKENPIRKSIDDIQPANGAKERMLANIKRKAASGANQERPEKRPEILPYHSMKKWALPVAACLAIGVIGMAVVPHLLRSHNRNNIVSPVEMGNPFVEVDGADEFESQMGITMDAPDGVEDVSYHIIDGIIAETDFTVDGHCYSLRATKESGDYSGLYGTETRTEQLDSERNVILTVIQSEEEFFTKITWSDSGVNYILSNTDGASENEIKAVWARVQ